MQNALFSTKKVNGFIIAASVLLMLIVLNLPFKAKPFGDDTFHVEAKNLALFLKGVVAYDQVLISKAPGPVLFYAIPYLAAPSDATDNQLWYYGVIFTSILIIISLILIFRIGSSFFSNEVGILSVLLFFIFPIHCYYTLGILAEGPAFFSLALAIYGWSIAFERPERSKGWILLVLGILLLILNRPNAMLLPGVGFVIVFYSWFRNKAFFHKFGKKLIVSLFVVGLIGFAALQTAKAITESKTNQNQESLLFYVAHQGRFQFREEPTDFRFWDNSNRADSKDYQSWVRSIEQLDAKIKTTGQKSAEVYRQFLIDDAIAHPFWFARQFFVKCFYGHIYFINSISPQEFHLGPLKGPTGYAVFIFGINAVNIVIIVGALIFLWRQKNLLDYWIFWGVIVSLLIFHGLTYMEPRYIFPSKVALYLMSAAGLYRIGWIRKSVDWFSALFYKKVK